MDEIAASRADLKLAKDAIGTEDASFSPSAAASSAVRKPPSYGATEMSEWSVKQVHGSTAAPRNDSSKGSQKE